MYNDQASEKLPSSSNHCLLIANIPPGITGVRTGPVRNEDTKSKK